MGEGEAQQKILTIRTTEGTLSIFKEFCAKTGLTQSDAMSRLLAEAWAFKVDEAENIMQPVINSLMGTASQIAESMKGIGHQLRLDSERLGAIREAEIQAMSKELAETRKKALFLEEERRLSKARADAAESERGEWARKCAEAEKKASAVASMFEDVKSHKAALEAELADARASAGKAKGEAEALAGEIGRRAESLERDLAAARKEAGEERIRADSLAARLKEEKDERREEFAKLLQAVQTLDKVDKAKTPKPSKPRAAKPGAADGEPAGSGGGRQGAD